MNCEIEDNVCVQVLATPAMRHLAAEKEVNLADVVPTGKGGRVVKEDILNYINSNTGEAPSDQVNNIMLHLFVCRVTSFLTHKVQL